ncbi:MAG TPA: host specificity factor TipJ family phage tail protein [Terriglobia bacterium]|nr:host specificity factor TipJ family phage tail protein [Terriglobia bacterium]
MIQQSVPSTRQELLSGARVVARPSPLSDRVIDIQVAAGSTVAEIFFEAGMNPKFIRHMQCWLVTADPKKNPVLIPLDRWEFVRPKPGITVTFRMAPHGGAGGQKGTLGIILRAVVVVIAAIATWYVGGVGGLAASAGFSASAAAAAGAAAGAVVSIAGNLAISALVPPSLPSTGNSGKASSPTYSISGTRNAANPYGPIPRVFGRWRYTPPNGANPYTEIDGNDQYVRCLFMLGYGPLDITDLKLGDTPLSNYQNVETVIHYGYSDDAPLSLYSNSPREQPISIDVTHAAGWVLQTTDLDTDEISLDLTFDRGLFHTNKKGNRHASNAVFQFQYSVASANAWVDLGQQTYIDNSTSPVRRSFRFKPPARGQYDVRVMRISEDDGDNESTHAVWTAIRSIQYGDPVTIRGVAMVELRIKGTDQLNGVVDNFNCLCTSVLPVWDGNTWTPKPTRNPAWCYLEVLRGRGNKRAVTDDRIYLPDFLDWSIACEKLASDGTAVYCCDGVIDYQSTVGQALQDIAAAGRATPGWRDGKFSIVRDVPQTVPMQHFTPRNSRGGQWTKTFAEQPHAIKIQFWNEEKGYQQDELYVYADGYDKTNASKFETLTLSFLARKNQIWRDARYFMAVAKLRPVQYTRSVDPEYLACRRGDMVVVADDVMLVGLGSGRIQSVTVDGQGRGTALTLDETFIMEAGKTYALRIRRGTGDHQLISIQTEPGQTSILTPILPIAAANLPSPDDLASFGETGLETAQMLVYSVAPDSDLGATLTLIDASPAVHDADQGPIPAFDAGITTAIPIAARRPPQPRILSVQSDENVTTIAQDGSLQLRIRVTLLPLTGGDVPATLLEAKYRPTDGAGDYTFIPRVAASSPSIDITPVQDGLAYDVLIRSIAANGATSEWTSELNYTVIGTDTPPPDPTVLRINGSKANWLYPDPPIDLAGFEVRARPGTTRRWDDAQLLQNGFVTICEADISNLGSGPWVVMVKAKDRAGHYSDGFADATINLGDVLVDNLVFSVDLAAQGFPGVIENGHLIGGSLLANDNAGAAWSANDNAPFWSANDNDPAWRNGYQAMSYTATILPGSEDVPSTMKISSSISGGSWQVLYRTNGDAAAWSTDDSAPYWTSDTDPAWADLSEFTPFPASLDATRQQYQIKVTTSAGIEIGRIYALEVLFDVPDESEIVRNIAVGIDGAIIPITKSYRSIKLIRYGLDDDGGSAVNARTLDYSATAPRVGCFNGSAQPTTGLIDYAEILGIKRSA